MGVPCVTLAGSCHAHNVGVSLLTTVGLKHQWIAQDKNEYIKLAIQASRSVKKMAVLRQELRQQMIKSPLCDGKKFVTTLESCYSKLYERYCNSAPASQQSVRQGSDPAQ